jgi:5-oxoprolinase (ATP-hydrolysing)
LKKWIIAVDTGGTFTDCLATNPQGIEHRVKILSNSTIKGIIEKIGKDWIQFSARWIFPVEVFKGLSFVNLINGFKVESLIDRLDISNKRIYFTNSVHLNKDCIGQDFEITSKEEAPVFCARLATSTPLGSDFPPLVMKLGTTRGTNALLEGKGSKTLLLVTKGFSDLLKIGNQQRPNLFSLNNRPRNSLYHTVIEVDERINALGEPLKSLQTSEIQRIKKLLKKGNYQAVAVSLMNSYLNPEHEKLLHESIQKSENVHISVSSTLSPLIRYLPRTVTAVIDAYISGQLQKYLDRVEAGIGSGNLKVMTSAGSLVHKAFFHPKDSLLSGPAGGVVGAAFLGRKLGYERLITFDMGGTSTDISRIDGDPEYRQEFRIGEVHLSSTAFAIDTIASGGGSICSYDGIKFSVGPESAGSSPGPACYGSGGPLTITDINLLLGRIDPSFFGIPLHKSEAEKAFVKLVTAELFQHSSREQILLGILNIANEKMAGAIRNISVKNGSEPYEYNLLSFGGAGGQHACAIARLLKIKNIIVPYDASLLSACGIKAALAERVIVKQVLKLWQEFNNEAAQAFMELEVSALDLLKNEGWDELQLVIRRRNIFVRFYGQNDSLELEWDTSIDIHSEFRNRYQEVYGHWLENQELEIESIRIIVSEKHSDPELDFLPVKAKPISIKSVNVYLNKAWQEVPFYDWDSLKPGSVTDGPALISNKFTSVLVESNWKLRITSEKNILLEDQEFEFETTTETPAEIKLELFTNRFQGLVKEMGSIIQRTSFSVNIKERLDFSCALLDAKGYLVVNAPHIPVHLGSLGLCTRQVAKLFDFKPGDVVITNHPGFGGSHLPDITLIAPVFDQNEVLVGFVANRAHHAEIGGKTPGSMPVDAMNLAEEGVVIAPFKLIQGGRAQWDIIIHLLKSAPFPTRSVDENLADLRGALASIQTGINQLLGICNRYGTDEVKSQMIALQNYVRHLSSKSLELLPGSLLKATEKLDDGSLIKVKLKQKAGGLLIDFTGSSKVHLGNLNATEAITYSTVIYFLRVLLEEKILKEQQSLIDLPLNEGLLGNVEVIIPPNCILNPIFDSDPEKCPAVVGGNTETSQRLTDTLFKAIGFCGCSQGTMNNLLFGNELFGYYETIGGGGGAGEGFNGTSAQHQHMTNTRITDPEILEFRYPVLLEEFSIRKDSGGNGKWKGGNGILRKLKFLHPLSLTFLSQHRKNAPYGMKGGKPGKKGNQYIIREQQVINLKGIDQFEIQANDILIINTPGGGGYKKSETPINSQPS